MPIVFKSESLNLLEPSGPVQGYNGIAFPFTFYMFLALLVYRQVALHIQRLVYCVRGSCCVSCACVLFAFGV
jgi:hypothetical protein